MQLQIVTLILLLVGVSHVQGCGFASCRYHKAQSKIFCPSNVSILISQSTSCKVSSLVMMANMTEQQHMAIKLVVRTREPFVTKISRYVCTCICNSVDCLMLTHH